MAAIFLLLWKGPWIFDGSHLRQKNLQPADGVVITGFRTMVVAILASAFAGLGLVYTHVTLQHTREKDREQVTLTREGQMTDRYATAIELMAAQELTKRLGGIYALERIMRDSPKDHETIIEVLAAFVREHAPRPEQDPDVPSERESAVMQEHVQAALTVLARRPTRTESFGINLRNTDLRGAHMPMADLREADLSGAFLEYADLQWADLHEANFEGCHLENVDLTSAKLTGSNLQRAFLCQMTLTDAELDYARMSWALVLGSSLVRTKFVKTNLHGARFINSNLDEADFTEARLMHAVFKQSNMEGAKLNRALLHGTDFSENDLDSEQFLSARVKQSTKVPANLVDNPSVSARLEAEMEQARTRAVGRTQAPPAAQA